MRIPSLVGSFVAASLVAAIARADPSSPAPAADAASTPAASAPPETKHGPRTPGILLLALGASGLITGATFATLATVTGADVRSNCTGNVCPPSQAGPLADAKVFQTASYAALIAGGAIATAGLVLTIVAPGDPEKSARVEPWVLPSGRAGAGVRVTVSF
jgi:hypothetical protein